MAAAAALPLLVHASPAATPSRMAFTVPGASSYKCSGPPVKLFDDTNAQSTRGGGTAPTFTTRGRTYCVLSIVTRHLATKGVSVGLRVVSGLGGTGNTFGPLAATGRSGAWTATVPSSKPLVVNGTYSCQDSTPASWVQNAASKRLGFCTVYGAAAVKTAPPPAAKPGWVCMGNQVTVFDNSNGGGVMNDARAPDFTTWKLQGVQAYCLTQIRTYHWNNGVGQKPGSIGLKRVGVGFLGVSTVPRRPAKGSAGQGGSADVNWQVDVPTSPAPTVISGIYACDDSDPATWSWNAQSKDITTGSRGFCTVYGVPAYPTGVTLPTGVKVTSPAGGATAPAGVGGSGGAAAATCASPPPTDFLVSPGSVPPGGTASLLLACGTPASNGFRGRLAPIGGGGVFMIGIGCAPFWTYTPGTAFLRYSGQPNQPCAGAVTALPYTVGGDTAVAVQVPNGTPAGKYVVYVMWSGGDAESMNTLNVS